MIERSDLKHLGRYQFDAANRSDQVFVIVYLKDLQGLKARRNNCWMQYCENDVVGECHISDDFLKSLTVYKPSKPFYNPRGWGFETEEKDVFWREQFYHYWQNTKTNEARIVVPVNGESRQKYIIRAAYELAPHTLRFPEVNHIYRAKKPRVLRYLFGEEYDDRQIVHIPEIKFGLSTRIQYDGATVKNGQHYPHTTLLDWLVWAGEDVTEHYKANVSEGRWDGPKC